MDKTYRDGVDMQTAFESQMKRATADPDALNPHASGQFGKSSVNRLGGMVKTTLRVATHSLYRKSKPVLRPVAFRVRSYLMAPIMQELQELQGTQGAQGDGLKELQSRLDRIEQYTHATARRVAVNCGPDEVLVRTEVGYVLCSAADHALLAELIEAHEPERGTRLLIQRLVGPGDVFIDVGASLGLHTLAAAIAMNGQGRIVAFEPFEPTQRLFQESVLMNGFAHFVEIHQAAVSDRTGHQRLFLGRVSTHHSLFPLTLPAEMGDPSVEVPLVRLDDIMGEAATIDLIKIDAEGAELAVLDGAKSLIEHNQEIALIVEFGPSHLRRTGVSASDWLLSFESLGLTYRVVGAQTGALETWSLQQLEEADSVNLLFARPDAHAWRKARPGVQTPSSEK